MPVHPALSRAAPFGVRDLLSALALVAACGCDPGWSYVVPQGMPVMADGQRFEIAGPDDTALRVYASLFTSSLTVEVDVTNRGRGALRVAPQALAVLDADGRELPDAEPRGPGPGGGSSGGGVVAVGARPEVSLAPGQTCRVEGRFTVSPGAKTLSRLTAVLRHVVRDGRSIPIAVPLERR